MAHRAQHQEHRQDMDDWEVEVRSTVGFSHWESVPTAQALSHSGKWYTANMLSPRPGKGHTELRKAHLHCLSALRMQNT